jgi:hypothetical protein
MQCLHDEGVSLSALDQLAGCHNLCYANASVQALLGWRPLLRILEASSSRDDKVISCALLKLCEVYDSMRISSTTGEYADIGPLMPNARLLDGAMEDPHDLLVPIWERMMSDGRRWVTSCVW